MPTQPIPEHIKQRFNTMLQAAANGDLALLSAQTVEGEQVWLLVGMKKDAVNYHVTPFGHFVSPDNPYDAYQDPTAEEAA